MDEIISQKREQLELIKVRAEEKERETEKQRVAFRKSLEIKKLERLSAIKAQDDRMREIEEQKRFDQAERLLKERETDDIRKRAYRDKLERIEEERKREVI